MSTRFFGEGNIGTVPELKMFPSSGNQAPRGLLRLNVRFDNLVPTEDGLIDRGGFWANVELWHRDAETWEKLYLQGLRVMVYGRMVQDTWKDQTTGQERSAFKVIADRVGILPYRVSSIAMESSSKNGAPASDQGTVGGYRSPTGKAPESQSDSSSFESESEQCGGGDEE